MAFLTTNNLLAFNADKLTHVVANYCHNSGRHYRRVVVSVCSGRSETEMSSQDLCVCLDKNKASLLSGAFASKYLFRHKSNVIFHYKQMRTGLLRLLRKIHDETELPVYVLFQHPDPSQNSSSRDDIACATRDCVKALDEKTIKAIHYVYDWIHKPEKTCWEKDCLQHLALSKCEHGLVKRVRITNPVIISKIDCTTVRHPLFGEIQRSGWAKMKKGYEMTFSIYYSY